MKKLFTVLVVLLCTSILVAAPPPVSQKLNYQAVVRNSSNQLVTNQPVGMKISILFGSATGTVVYAETQTPTTNANGLINISIGSGVVVSGTYSTIEWGSGTHFLKTEIDPTGGTAYSITSTSELLSVPYALYSDYTKTAKNTQSLLLPLNINANLNSYPIFSITNTGTAIQTIAGISTSGSGIYGETKDDNSPGVFGVGSGSDISMGVLGNTGESSGYPGIPGNVGVLGRSSANIGIAGTSVSGTGGYLTSSTGIALLTKGGLKLTGIGEAAGRILTSDAMGNATWQTPGVDVTLPGGINGNIQFNNNSVFGGDNNLNWNNINKRLGLGTTAPEGMIEIKGNSTTSMPQLLLTETQTEFARLTFKNTANVSRMWTIAGQTNSDDKYSMLNFWYDNGTSGKDILTINGNGKIGIGNSMPKYNLVIDGGSGNTEINLITTSTGSSFSDGLRIGMGLANAWLWNNEDGELYFGTNNQRRMTILNNGFVGIGDGSPEATLDVEGTVVIGSAGKVFSEIREITGTTSATTGTTTFSYPTGYTKDNIRVLSCEINYNGNAWIGLAGATNPNETSKVFYYLDSTLIWIYHQSTVNFQNRAFRMMVMKVQ